MSETTKCTEEECKKLYSGIDKLKVAILAGLLFLLLALPFTHNIVSKFVKPMGFNILSENNGLSVAGLFVMAMLYAIITRLLML